MNKNFKEFFKEKDFKNIFNKKKENENESARIYKVLEDDEEEKKMKKINLFDRIKFIRFQNKNSDRKLNTEKIKDFGLIATAVILIGIGYSNFSDNKQSTENVVQTYSKSTNNIGDVELVSSNAVLVENDETNSFEVNLSAVSEENNTSETSQTEETSNLNQESNEEVKETGLVSNSISEENQAYFSKLKMERSDMYSKSLETYQKIIDSSSISNEQKAIAIQEIENINNLQNSISIAEELIKLKGFDDVVIYGNSDSISVIVRISALSSSQVAQIQNIVSKQLNIDISNITISNK